MPPRRSASASEFLTPDDLTALAATVADGKTATVYLREGISSLGLVPGASARVISVSGSTVTIKPRGVDDELPYEADELRMTKNVAPQDKPKGTRTKAAPAPTPHAARASQTASATPKSTHTPKSTDPATPERAATPKSTAAAKSASPKPARRTTSRNATPKPPASVTVTLFGSPDNAWSVSVTRGGRKPTRSRTVTPDSVEAAMAGLADDAAIAATSSVLNAAREQAQRRVDELSAELAAAQALLDNLGAQN